MPIPQTQEKHLLFLIQSKREADPSPALLRDQDDMVGGFSSL
jgi:hypothetical protein